MKDFFISYDGQDKSWAEWIAWMLEEAGYTTVIQAWDFRPGGNFVLEMQKAATGTNRTIAVLSDHYLAAEYTQPEWADAFARDPQGRERTLLPVRVSRCRPSGLLATRIYVDLIGLGSDEARQTLLDAIVEREKPATPAAFPGSAARQPSPSARPSTKRSFPGHASDAIAVWQEKLEFLRMQEALASDPAQKFTIKKQIQEATAKIKEWGAPSTLRSSAAYRGAECAGQRGTRDEGLATSRSSVRNSALPSRQPI